MQRQYVSDAVYPRGRRFGFLVGGLLESTGQKNGQRWFTYPTREEAEKERLKWKKAAQHVNAEAEAKTFADAIEDYCEDRREEMRPRSLETLRGRLRRFFATKLDEPALLSPAAGQTRYDELRPTVSVQEHRHCLSRAKAFSAWMVEKGRWRQNPLAGVKPKGSPNRGKPQLTMDEWVRFVRWCVIEAQRGDEGAAVAAVVASFGVRASEACGLSVRDVDQGGMVLVVRGTKSEAADRSLEVPRPKTPDDQTPNMWRLLQDQIVRAKRAERVQLFGRDRWWVRREVIRCCVAAGVPVVPPHGLRGSWASTSRRIGAVPLEVAFGLGHAGTSVQDRHYVQPGASAQGAQRTALAVLRGGKA